MSTDIQKNVIEVAIRILEKHIASSPNKIDVSSLDKKDLLNTAIKIVNAYRALNNKSANTDTNENSKITPDNLPTTGVNPPANTNSNNTEPESKNTEPNKTDITMSLSSLDAKSSLLPDNSLRRGPTTFVENVLAPDMANLSGPLINKKVYSSETIPTYPNKKGSNLIRPESFVTKLNINGIPDRSGEIDALNKAIEDRKKEIDELTEQVNKETELLNEKVVA